MCIDGCKVETKVVYDEIKDLFQEAEKKIKGKVNHATFNKTGTILNAFIF